jgi:hypothetical protein
VPRPPVDFEEQKPRPDDPADMANAIWELSNYPVGRAYVDVKTKTADYTMDPLLDRVILADGTGGAVLITLPAAADADFVRYTVVAIDVSGGNVSVLDGGLANILGVTNGSPGLTMATAGLSITVVSDGTNYHRVDNL